LKCNEFTRRVQEISTCVNGGSPAMWRGRAVANATTLARGLQPMVAGAFGATYCVLAQVRRYSWSVAANRRTKRDAFFGQVETDAQVVPQKPIESHVRPCYPMTHGRRRFNGQGQQDPFGNQRQVSYRLRSLPNERRPGANQSNEQARAVESGSSPRRDQKAGRAPGSTTRLLLEGSGGGGQDRRDRP
jgi:hypothetical protein